MILNQVNMPQLLNLQVVLRDRLHPQKSHEQMLAYLQQQFKRSK